MNYSWIQEAHPGAGRRPFQEPAENKRPLVERFEPPPSASRGPWAPSLPPPPPPSRSNGMPASQGMRTPPPRGPTPRFAPMTDETMDNVPYSSQLGDYKFYCGDFGVCPPTMREGFVAPTNAVDTRPPGSSEGSVDMCGRASPTSYASPYSDADKAQYQASLQYAVRNDPPKRPTWTAPMPARKVDMNQVMGYEDDELSQYMSFNQMKASPVSSHNVQPPPAQNANGAGLHEAFDTTSPAGMLSGMPPSVSVANVAAPVVPDATVGVVPLPAPAAFTPTNANVDADANATWLGRWLGPSWADLLLFSVAGLLLLLLLDLLFRLATQVGMRDTLQTLEAIAARLAANAPQKGGILTGAPLDFEMPSLLPFPEVACGQV